MTRCAIAAIALLALAACDETDYGSCLKSHDEMGVYYQYLWGPNMTIIGIIPIYYTYSVCDQWEFPNGRTKEES